MLIENSLQVGTVHRQKFGSVFLRYTIAARLLGEYDPVSPRMNALPVILIADRDGIFFHAKHAESLQRIGAEIQSAAYFRNGVALFIYVEFMAATMECEGCSESADSTPDNGGFKFTCHRSQSLCSCE